MKTDKRKIVICQRCSKEKIHFGLGMCSACLRRTKRETRPSFYLGTCYSEMSRRTKFFDPKRPQYFGKAICTKEEFINRFINDKNFLLLYEGWQKSGFKRKNSTSIDRVNNNLDYTIDNLEFISHYENSTKDVKIKLKLSNGKEEFMFNSQKEAAAFLNTHPSTITNCKQLKENYKGWKIEEL